MTSTSAVIRSGSQYALTAWAPKITASGVSANSARTSRKMTARGTGSSTCSRGRVPRRLRRPLRKVAGAPVYKADGADAGSSGGAGFAVGAGKSGRVDDDGSGLPMVDRSSARAAAADAAAAAADEGAPEASGGSFIVVLP
jgi:hypothetical protein